MGNTPLGGFYDEVAVGDEATSIGRTITEADLVGYANTTGCWLPIHTDAEFAGQTRYGERVVQGTFLLGLAEGLLYPNQPTGIRANMGIEAVEFRRPVFVGDTVHFDARVTETEDRDDESGTVELEITGYTQDDTPVVSYSTTLLMLTEDAATAEAARRDR